MADGILVSSGSVDCNESSLTGESATVKKTRLGDCFLLSSCLVTGGDECRILVTGIGSHSQWGRIKLSLVTEAQQTPLQAKLETMSTQVNNTRVCHDNMPISPLCRALNSFGNDMWCVISSLIDRLPWNYSCSWYIRSPDH